MDLQLDKSDTMAWEAIRKDPATIKWVLLPTFEMLMYVKSKGIIVDINASVTIRLTPDEIEYLRLM